MTRMRSISTAYEEIKTADPSTALTPHSIRRLILQKKIPYVTAGSKYLLNLDALEEYLNAPPSPVVEPTRGTIRRISP